MSSHAEGMNTKSYGSSSHAGGSGSESKGDASFSHGSFTQSNNDFESSFGRYNKSNTGTIFSIGSGSSTTNRSNIFEVMSNGDIYIKGIGGYDGTNAGQSGIQTLQDVLLN